MWTLSWKIITNTPILRHFYGCYAKIKLIRQEEGGSPVTVTGFSSIGVQAYPRSEFDSTITFFRRATYTYQLLIARKISSRLSLQISPTFLHSNRIDQSILKNDQLAFGFGGRYKLTGSFSINAEYYGRMNPVAGNPYYSSVGIGFDIETGGHVFQLVFTNSQGTVERTFIGETEGKFFRGGIHFGFNVTRTFQKKKKKAG